MKSKIIYLPIPLSSNIDICVITFKVFRINPSKNNFTPFFIITFTKPEWEYWFLDKTLVNHVVPKNHEGTNNIVSQ